MSVNSGNFPVIAVIGCGAIAETLHMPGLARHPDIMARSICIDSNLRRAESLAETFGAARAAARYRDVIDELDAAIVAVPAKLHFPIASDLIARRIPTFCEKPL